MFDSPRIIAERQAAQAALLAADRATELSGPVAFAHQYVDMTKVEVAYPDGRTGVTCPAAMGYSFAAGTTDGPGAFDFIQVMQSTLKRISVTRKWAKPRNCMKEGSIV